MSCHITCVYNSIYCRMLKYPTYTQEGLQRMYVCMYVCMYLFIYVYVFMYVYIYIYIYTYKHRPHTPTKGQEGLQTTADIVFRRRNDSIHNMLQALYYYVYYYYHHYHHYYCYHYC